jgi:hypothetical protein
MEEKSKSIKITIPDTVYEEASNALRELRTRSAKVTLDDLFVEGMASFDSGYFKRQIEKFTPEEYIIGRALQSTEARAYLLKHALRALEAMDRGEVVKIKRTRMRKPKDSKDECQI